MNTVEFKQQPGKISVGQYYTRDGCVYILAAASADTYQLTNLATGLRYVKPAKAKDKSDITPDEFQRICDGDEFTRITTPITITPEA